MPAPPGPITVDTPLGPDALVFRAMQGTETLGAPFLYALDLVGSDPNVDLSALLGQVVVVHVQVGDEEARHVHGYVTGIRLIESSLTAVVYQATVQPWLSLLAYTTNCRIFQNRSVPTILKEIFRERGFSDFEDALSGEYPKLDYVVQYRESDFAFLSRLMERAGIYYYFRHTAQAHTLVLSDAYYAHTRTPGCETLAYRPPDGHRPSLEQSVDRWEFSQGITSGAVVLNDFDFQRPKAPLSAKVAAPKEHARADFEVYDYPGGYIERQVGDGLARLRLEQNQASFRVAAGHTNAPRFACGALFALSEHPRDDQNLEFLVTSTSIALAGQELSTTFANGEVFSCEFQVVDAQVSFRSAPLTKKPTVEGPQTAVVVGKDGEEIWTDSFGRVKVQFHWDRLGTSDENSSCWVRVAQVWAGTHWGAMHVPRIGQEVIVDFLEGDPDRPIVTGRVYNGNNMPPYDLPKHDTQSGIKSRSTKGGNVTNANELRFEDLKGQEELYVQAERNQTTLVKVNQSLSVGANRTASVGANESISIGANQTVSVGGTRTTTVTKAETEKYKATREMTVDDTDTVTIAHLHKGTYNGGREVNVSGAADNLTVTGVNKVTTVNQEYNITAAQQFKVTQNGDSLLMKDALTVVSTGPIKVSNPKCSVELADGKITLTADAEIGLVCGSASITLKKDGSIEITGQTKVSLSGGQGAIDLAAAGATMSGPKVTVSGASMTEISGAIVKIN